MRHNNAKSAPKGRVQYVKSLYKSVGAIHESPA